jgi:anti-sigma factor ChrR (cupin superfamily)
MTKKESILHTQDMEWSELSDFPGPADVKILPHSHRGVVQHYVLEGQYETEGQRFGPGSFRLMPKHADVAPISTDKGVTILMIYDPIS